KLDNLRAGELEGCRLAETADFGEVSCAANERVLIINDQLAGCTFARAARFGPLTLPVGASVTYNDGRPSNFRLPSQGAPIDGFGLILPPGTKGDFCFRSDTPEHLEVSRSAYVTIDNVKLTGWVGFDCKADSAFERGTLFEDAMVAGKWRQRGDLLSHDDLFPQKGG
ncbi:MAG TPA: hypothetical protein VGR70_07540, partial [Stellaceae bacterium]|nr:hypothetical protein [Stellaceae bacterium]